MTVLYEYLVAGMLLSTFLLIMACALVAMNFPTGFRFSFLKVVMILIVAAPVVASVLPRARANVSLQTVTQIAYSFVDTAVPAHVSVDTSTAFWKYILMIYI